VHTQNIRLGTPEGVPTQGLASHTNQGFPNQGFPNQSFATRGFANRGFTTEDILWAVGIWSVIICLSPVIVFYMLMVA
jgi:hypothetical protein